jgi:hypothetical protein
VRHDQTHEADESGQADYGACDGGRRLVLGSRIAASQLMPVASSKTSTFATTGLPASRLNLVRRGVEGDLH